MTDTFFDEYRDLFEDIEVHGMNYALIAYDVWYDFPDEEFQKVYLQYVESHKNMVNFLKQKSNVIGVNFYE